MLHEDIATPSVDKEGVLSEATASSSSSDALESLQAERYQRLAIEILAVLNDAIGWNDTISRILAAIKRDTGFDAIGIRLQDNDDFPYAVQDGFSQDFLLTENSLLVRDQNGSPCRDKHGKFSLECTCGMVLSAQEGVPNPLLTEGGSFWTNNALPLLDIPAKDEPRLHPRNKCIHLGYRSMAIVPVRANHAIVGLLQLNDRRKDCFTLEMIRFFEGISASIGVALRRKWNLEALLAKEEEWRSLFSVLPVGVSILNKQHEIKEFNPALAAILGISKGGFLDKAYSQLKYLRADGTVMPPEEFPSTRAEQGQEVVRCIPIGVVKEDGTTVWTEVSAAPLHSSDSACVVVTTDITQRMQAEAENERFKASFENGSVPQALTSLDGRFLQVNDAMARMLGYPCAELEGKLFNDVTHPDDRGFSARVREELLSGKGTSRFEKRYVTHAGATVWLDVNITAVRASDGTPKYFFGTFLDVSERKRDEAELSESRRCLRLALDSAGMGVWHWDMVEDKRYFDDQTCAMLGIDRANFRGTYDEFLACVHPDDRENLKKALASAVSNDAPYECDCTAIWQNGSKHAITTRGRLLRDVKGRPLRVDGIIWDQTDRARARQALCESEDRFRQLANVFPQTVFEADLTGRMTYLNEHGLRLNNATQADLEKGIDVLGMVLPEERPKVLQHMRERIETRTSGYFENRIVRENGEIFDVLVYAVPIMSQECVVGIRGVVLDISERKQAERKLLEVNRLLERATARANAMAARAESASRAKSEFLANMSHEIRTPMNGIIGLTGLLLDTDLTAEQRNYAETVCTSADSLLSLLNDILDFSKIEAGKLDLDIIDFDLCALVGDLTGVMGRRASEKHLKFQCSVSPNVPSKLRGDSGRLRQVLVNLTANALKFTDQGEVAVRGDLARESPDDVVVRFSVRDTGIGIPSDKQGGLFQQFSQVDASITRKFGGSGLGLAISKQLVKLMGGEIGVSSQEGRGSEFWFTVRLEKQASRKAKPQSSGAARPAYCGLNRRGIRILLAEDNITNQMVAAGILRKLGLQPDVAHNGKEAVEAMRKVAYDLVLMDLQMPEMDGLEATRVVRASGSNTRNPSVPIIALTAHAMSGDSKICLDAGMDDYIAKPVTPVALSTLLEKWLAKVDVATRQEGTHPRADSSPASSDGSSQAAAEMLFDEAALVERSVGDRDLAQTILCSFLADIPGRLEALKSHVEAGDAKSVERQAHSIKGAAAAVGGKGLAQLAFTIEKSGNAGDLSAARSGLEKLVFEFKRLKAAIENSSLLAAAGK